MKKIYLLALLVVTSSKIFAQPPVKPWTFFINKIDSVCNNVTADFPVKVSNFRNVVGFQGSINWDTSIVKFDTVLVNQTLPNFRPIDFASNLQKNAGFVSFLWVDSTANVALNYPDSTTLFILRLRMNNSSSGTAPIYFANFPTPLSIDTATDLVNLSDLGTTTDTLWKAGYVKFIDSPKLVQTGAFTFISTGACNPIYYIWKVFDCNGNLYSTDTTTSNTYTVNVPPSMSNCYSVECAARYGNGRTVGSERMTTYLLPLKIIKFNITQTPTNVSLNWQTTNEENVSHFNIQKSNNGKNFSNIGKVNAGKTEYSFTDNRQQSTVFYRLEVVDKDGSKTYSVIKQLEIKNQKSEIAIYPNPSKGNVTIETKDVKEIVIVDGIGKSVQKQIINNQFSIINIQLKSGLYFIKALLKNGETKIEKLIVE